MQLFSLIICFAQFTDPIRDVTDIRQPDRGFRRLVCKWCSFDLVDRFLHSYFIVHAREMFGGARLKMEKRKVDSWIIFRYSDTLLFHSFCVCVFYVNFFSFNKQIRKKEWSFVTIILLFSYQLASDSPLARLYSTSTLERHHLNQTLVLLNLKDNT